MSAFPGCPECPRTLKVIPQRSERRALGGRVFNTPRGPWALACEQHGRATDWFDPQPESWFTVTVRTHETQQQMERAQRQQEHAEERAARERARLAAAQPAKAPVTNRRGARREATQGFRTSSARVAQAGLGAGKGQGQTE